MVNAAGVASTLYGPFPNGILRASLAESLVVNAWDPHSICGNGNAVDRSLDGYVGRHTAVAVLTWPVVNTRMRYVACDDTAHSPLPTRCSTSPA